MMNEISRELFSISSNAGFMPVVLSVLTDENGVILSVETNDDVNPIIKIPKYSISDLGRQLKNINKKTQTISWNSGFLSRAWLAIKTGNNEICSCKLLVLTVIPLTLVCFKIEKQKLIDLGVRLDSYASQ